MFKKAQIKLFSFIVSILLAVFVGLLGAINVITKELVSRQSQYVLEQIAAGIEYNDKEETFVIVRPDNVRDKKNDIWKDEFPEEKPKTTTKAVTTTETVTTTAETTTALVTEEIVVDEPDENEWENITDPPAETDPPTNPPTDPPAETDPPTNPPTNPEQPPPEWTMPEYDPNNNPWGNPWENPWNNPWYNPWLNPWANPWGQWNQQYPDENMQVNGDEPKHDGEHNRDDDFRRENTAYSGNIYDGGIVQLGNTITTTPKTTTAPKPSNTEKPPKKPDGKMNDDLGKEPIPKTIGSIDFFIIMADNDGRLVSTLNNDELSDGTAQNYINAVISNKKNTGMLNEFQYFTAKKSNGTMMVFTDKSNELEVFSQLKRTTIIIGIISIVILSIAAYFMSKKSMEPIEFAFERQKQFVSDASHELKTPLTVISANADVLYGEIGENKWLKYIMSQTERMNVLVNDLLNLTRLENNTTDFIRLDFDMSKAVINTALPFECQAFEQNKKFIIDVDEDITVNGSERHLKQMAAIFIDNALKYSDDGGTVKVMLKKQGDKKIFSVYNTGSGVKEDEKEKIFERFFRSDASRNRSTGGYGLGLAIAKSVVEKHKFKVNVINQEGRSICFVVTM